MPRGLLQDYPALLHCPFCGAARELKPVVFTDGDIGDFWVHPDGDCLLALDYLDPCDIPEWNLRSLAATLEIPEVLQLVKEAVANEGYAIDEGLGKAAAPFIAILRGSR